MSICLEEFQTRYYLGRVHGLDKEVHEMNLKWYLTLLIKYLCIVITMGLLHKAKEPRSHQKSKHVLRCYHMILEIISRVKIERVPTDQNVIDPLTKVLHQDSLINM